MIWMKKLSTTNSGNKRQKWVAKKVAFGLVWAAILCTSFLAIAGSPNHDAPFRWATPAGYDVVVLKPAGVQLSLLGLIECAELEGAQQVNEGVSARIVAADGHTITHFPRNFSFRVTASLRKTLLTPVTTEINSSHDPLDFLTKLKFILKSYNGMEMRLIEPESVQMIGVPADVPFDERIYRINFDLDQLPVTERFVLEVISPEGERLTRFHFDLL